MKALRSITLVFLIIAVLSCRQNPSLEKENSEFITITSEQFNSEDMELGKPQKRVFEEVVNCRGYIVPTSKGKILISVPVSGTIHKIFTTPGMKVSEGKVLFEVTGNELFDLQKNYAESAAQLSRLKSEFNRIKELYLEKIGAEKEYLLAESNYKSALSEYSALKMKLDVMGLDASEIEEGRLYASYPVKSAINGHIAYFNITLGQYVEPQTTLLEVIDLNQLQLKLSVFSKDIILLDIGQQIRFFQSDDKTRIGHAVLSAIGAAIDNESKAIDCYGTLKEKDQFSRISNEYVEARIIVKSDSVLSVPSDALLKSENNSYLLQLNKAEDGSYLFTMIKAETGRQNENFTEILNENIQGEFLTKGVYNIVPE